MHRLKPALNGVLRRLTRLGVPVVEPEVLETRPHDPEAFVQGLAYAEGTLYESTGRYGHSSLRRLDDAGAVAECVEVPGHFAEGIAVLDARIYQLTLSSHRVLVYDRRTLQRVGMYELPGPGWGLASDGAGLVVSDGSSVLQVRDGAFALDRWIPVRSHGLPVRGLNDIEVAGGLIFANLWYRAELAAICRTTGRLAFVVDCRRLRALEAPDNPHHILNGIAHDPVGDRFFLTGKHWRRLFVVRIPNPLAPASPDPAKPVTQRSR